MKKPPMILNGLHSHFFRWNVSEKDLGFFRLIRERLFSIEEYNTSTVHNKKVYDYEKRTD